MKISLLGNRVIIKPIKDEEEKKSKGGIVIPITIKDKVEKGTVLFIGDEVSVLKPDDIVIYYTGAGIEFPMGNEECRLMHEKPDVVAVI